MSIELLLIVMSLLPFAAAGLTGGEEDEEEDGSGTDTGEETIDAETAFAEFLAARVRRAGAEHALLFFQLGDALLQPL